MSERRDCSARVYDSPYGGGRSCSKRGTVERGGKWFCGTHDPVAQKARRDGRQAQWRAKHEELYQKRVRVTRIAEAEANLLREVIATDIRHLPESLIAARQALLDAKVEPAAAVSRQENR